MGVQLETTQAAILDRVIRPNSGDWSRVAAEAILGIGFDRRDRERMTLLLEKAKTGDLSNEEAEALENYRQIGKLVELMKARASFIADLGGLEGWQELFLCLPRGRGWTVAPYLSQQWIVGSRASSGRLKEQLELYQTA